MSPLEKFRFGLELAGAVSGLAGWAFSWLVLKPLREHGKKLENHETRISHLEGARPEGAAHIHAGG